MSDLLEHRTLMEFERRKSAALASLRSAIADKSPKGTVDEPILPLLKILNSHKSFYTTSSCSGRISILSSPSTSSDKKKARGGSWIFISHSPSDPDQVVPLLFGNPKWCSLGNELVFRFEPFILAVECRDVEQAGLLVSLAIRCGFRESGITSIARRRDRVIVGIRSSIRMEVPIGVEGRVLVGEEYVRFLVDIANKKMEANRQRYEGFMMAFKEEMLAAGPIVEEGLNTSVDTDKDTGLPSWSMTVERLVTSGEPREKLYLWGHSACALNLKEKQGVFVFGGFGGVGRHCRRNDSLFLDPSTGTLCSLDFNGIAPSPRLGHSASLVDDNVYIIGGRADPLNVLGDVCVFDTVNKIWRTPTCSGNYFSPRHRHAVAVVGSNIYVHGGVNNETVLSSVIVLDTRNLNWKELSVGGEQPCARHSHAMVAYGLKLFIFGGYDGERVLGDLYSFDTQRNIWKKESTVGKSPHSRFSHSMFVYDNYLGIIGGCPVGEDFQEVAYLDLDFCVWKRVTLNSIGQELLVRSTVSIVGDVLVIIGGGAACYAFGTKFSEPLKIKLRSITCYEKKYARLIKYEANKKSQDKLEDELTNKDDSHWVLQLERKHAKQGKDLLKKFMWLDEGRKVHSKMNGSYICFPVAKCFTAMFQCKNDEWDLSIPKENVSLMHSYQSVLTFLKECGAKMLIDDVRDVRKPVKSHSDRMRESVAALFKLKGLPEDLCDQLPTRWERLDDMVVLPISSLCDPLFESIRNELWLTIARSLNCSRLARQGRVASSGTRDSTLELLLGDDGWVDHRENGILYSFDATKSMFSWGNFSEKLRMANLNCEDEVIVDLFAGIGYFVLPFLVRAKARLVYACEWNPNAVEALKRNLEQNFVADRCIVLEGDNRMIAPKGVADRVCLGLIPTSEGSWATAVKALREDGGILHIHGNVKDTEESSWTNHIIKSISDTATLEGHSWCISVQHVERVKSYAPHIRHLVADVCCTRIPT